jgi:hypothetical protein
LLYEIHPWSLEAWELGQWAAGHHQVPSA